MAFKKVVGHLKAKKVLQNALAENRVAHAYLFHGPAGIGKTVLAKALAGALLCREDSTDACGKCSVCRRLETGQFPDFFMISPPPGHAVSTIKIDQVRELQKKAQFKPYEAQRKVYLIDRAEGMTRDAANCLLKVLEDPPPDTIFLLTTVNPHRLPPTIISRCQMIPLTKVPASQIEEMLVSGRKADHETAILLAALADGMPGKALEMAEESKGLETRSLVFQTIDRIDEGNINELLKTAEELEKQKELIPEVLELLMLWYRDQLLWIQTADEQFIINIDKLNRLKARSQVKKDYLVRSITDIMEAKARIGQNVNLKLTLEVLLLRLARSA